MRRTVHLRNALLGVALLLGACAHRTKTVYVNRRVRA